VAIGGLAGAVLIAAKAGSDYFTAYDEINKAIISTGNIAGTSALQIMASSQSIAASTGATVGTVQSLMTELVGMGSLTQQRKSSGLGAGGSDRYSLGAGHHQSL
jgi:phage-related minor tail protein